MFRAAHTIVFYLIRSRLSCLYTCMCLSLFLVQPLTFSILCYYYSTTLMRMHSMFSVYGISESHAPSVISIKDVRWWFVQYTQIVLGTHEWIWYNIAQIEGVSMADTGPLARMGWDWFILAGDRPVISSWRGLILAYQAWHWFNLYDFFTRLKSGNTTKFGLWFCMAGKSNTERCACVRVLLHN